MEDNESVDFTIKSEDLQTLMGGLKDDKSIELIMEDGTKWKIKESEKSLYDFLVQLPVHQRIRCIGIKDHEMELYFAERRQDLIRLLWKVSASKWLDTLSNDRINLRDKEINEYRFQMPYTMRQIIGRFKSHQFPLSMAQYIFDFFLTSGECKPGDTRAEYALDMMKRYVGVE